MEIKEETMEEIMETLEIMANIPISHEGWGAYLLTKEQIENASHLVDKLKRMEDIFRENHG